MLNLETKNRRKYYEYDQLWEWQPCVNGKSKTICPPYIESGTINVQFSTTARTYNVTFKNAFKEPPVVQLTVRSGQIAAHARALIEGNTTTTGFKFSTYDADSTTASGTVHWLAVEQS